MNARIVLNAVAEMIGPAKLEELAPDPAKRRAERLAQLAELGVDVA